MQVPQKAVSFSSGSRAGTSSGASDDLQAWEVAQEGDYLQDDLGFVLHMHAYGKIGS